MKQLLWAISAIWIGCVTVAFGDSIAPSDSVAPQETAKPAPVTIAELVAHAYDHNPTIQASRQSWRAAVEQYRLATGYPDPQVAVTYFPNPIQTRLGPQDWNATISQQIPFPGKLSQAGQVAAADARIAQLALDQTAREVATAVRVAAHELIYLQQARKIAAGNAELLDQLRKISEAAHAQDRAALRDVIKAQSQTGQLRYDIILLEELTQTERTRLNSLLNRPPDAVLGELTAAPAPALAYRLPELYKMAADSQEAIRMADVGIEKAAAKLDLATYQNLPDFKVGLFYAGIGEPEVAAPPPDAGDDAFGVQFGISIPLWVGKNSGRLAQARAETKKAQAMRQARVNQSHTDIHALFFKMQNAWRLIELYGNDLLPQAMRSLETAETWFREGQGSFSDFIESQATVYNFQLSLARARTDYSQALARLEMRVGRPLSGAEAANDPPVAASGKEGP